MYRGKVIQHLHVRCMSYFGMCPWMEDTAIWISCHTSSLVHLPFINHYRLKLEEIFLAPIYHASIYKLILTVLEILDNTEGVFSSVGRGSTRSILWSNVTCISIPKIKWDFGVKGLRKLNISLFCKWWWKLEMHPTLDACLTISSQGLIPRVICSKWNTSSWEGAWCYW